MKKLKLYFLILSIFLATSIQGEESMATSAPPLPGICDLAAVYQGPEGFNYSVPKGTLNEWLHGVGFGRDTPYTEEELSRVAADANEIFANQISQGLSTGKEVIITAGAPGGGKTTLLGQIKAQREQNGETLGYSDPDAVSLKQMTATYLVQVKTAEGLPIEEQKAIREQAYANWRPASNAIHHLMNAQFMARGISFCYGTTATGDKTHFGLKALKDAGYTIRLIHVTAPDAVRVGSIQERDREFIQTTAEDIIEKAKLLPQRIADTYMKYADTVEFHYRDRADADATLSAVWVRNEGTADGHLEIRDPAAYDAVKTWHNSNLYGRDDLRWETTVEPHCK